MAKRKILHWVKIFLIISMVFIPIIISSYSYIFNNNFYQEKFAKYGVAVKFKDVDMKSYNSRVLEYLSGKGRTMPEDIPLNNREIAHMKDVEKVFAMGKFFSYIIFISTIGILLFLYFFKQENFMSTVSRSLKYSGVISLILAIIIAALFYFAFNYAFAFFHLLFFKGNSWLFLPTDNLVNIYTEKIFFEICIQIFILSILISAGMYILSLILKKFIKAGKTNAK